MGDVKLIGGKGAGLVWLAENTDLGFEVPDFEIIDTTFYEDFIKQSLFARLASMLHEKAEPDKTFTGAFSVPGRLEERCNVLYEKFKGDSVAVRSSGVVSEDSDKFSGAGIYDSFFIEPEDLTPKTLLDAVLKVYASVNNPRAVQYRLENWLGQETMAVIVQKVGKGYNGVAMSRLQARAGI
ncbi:MAG: hypothetical protein KKE20_07060, partial [Nanoarchaeota archaeon]|nr:hypothetical protein [Nanoarchaeota archaeon]